jgi:hypothetical protein
MGVNLAALTQTAMKAAEKSSVVGSLTITRPAGTTINPTTGAASGSSLTQTIPRAVAMKPGVLRSRGGAWTEASAGVFFAASDLTWTPVQHDQGTWGGRTYLITEVQPIAPTGVVIAYELALGPYVDRR